MSDSYKTIKNNNKKEGLGFQSEPQKSLKTKKLTKEKLIGEKKDEENTIKEQTQIKQGSRITMKDGAHEQDAFDGQTKKGISDKKSKKIKKCL